MKRTTLSIVAISLSFLLGGCCQFFDIAPPVITLIGDSTVYVAKGESYEDPGVTATDDCDGDVTENVVITAVGADRIGSGPNGETLIIYNTTGTYEVTYDVSDAAGNAADQVTRTVVVRDPDAPDTTDPVITLTGGDLIEITEGEPFTDPGATASDDFDGDITGDIVVSGSVDADVPGTYELTYSVSDSAGNTATAVRTVVVVPTPTAVTLTVSADGNGTTDPSGATTVTAGVAANIEATADPGWVFDGWSVLTGSATFGDSNSATTTVTLSGGDAAIEAQFRTLGDGTITYRLTGAADHNGTSVLVTVFEPETVDFTDPANVVAEGAGEIAGGTAEFVLDDNSTPSTPFVFPGGAYLLSSLIDVDGSDARTTGDYDQSATADILVDGNAELELSYPHDFTLYQPDTTAPVISLSGDEFITLLVGEPFVDPGATAIDNVDGDISDRIVVTGTVDTDVAGTYELRYNVSDSAGNAAAEKTRTVFVTTPKIMYYEMPDTVAANDSFVIRRADSISPPYTEPTVAVSSQLPWPTRYYFEAVNEESGGVPGDEIVEVLHYLGFDLLYPIAEGTVTLNVATEDLAHTNSHVLTVTEDVTPPQLGGIDNPNLPYGDTKLLFFDESTILLLFTEPIEETTAFNTANFAVRIGTEAPAAPVSAGYCGEDPTMIALELSSALSVGEEVTVAVENLEDDYGNVIVSESVTAEYVAATGWDSPSLYDLYFPYIRFLAGSVEYAPPLGSTMLVALPAGDPFSLVGVIGITIVVENGGPALSLTYRELTHMFESGDYDVYIIDKERQTVSVPYTVTVP